MYAQIFSHTNDFSICLIIHTGSQAAGQPDERNAPEVKKAVAHR